MTASPASSSPLKTITMVLLHGLIKKAEKIPPQDLQLARQRLRALHEVL